MMPSYFEPQGDEEYYDYIQSTESDENNDYEGVSKDFDEYSEWLSYRKNRLQISILKNRVFTAILFKHIEI